MKKNGYYTVLHIPPDATQEEIETAYRRERKAYELEGRAFRDSRARELEEAYEVLSDEERRRSYDENQNRAVMTMEELEQKAQENHAKTRFESMVDAFIENPLEMLALTVLALLLVLATRS